MKITRKLTPYLFLIPALIILSIIVFYPALQAFSLSFTKFGYDLTQPPEWVGLENFKRLAEDKLFRQTLINTLIYLLGVVPPLVFLSLILAIVVNQKLRGINWFRTAYYTPVVVSMVVAGLAWKAIYWSNGILNQFWFSLGFKDGIPWLTSPDFAIWSVMVVTIWKGLGYYMVIYLAGLQGISPELYEAASIEGSDGWKKHWDITIPLMKPYIFLVAVISALSATKVFEEIYLLTQGGPRNATKTVVYYLYEKAFKDLDFNYASTMGLVLFTFILVLSIVNLSLSRKVS
ncbi:carbohydrate ABC transporter permease [Geminocystis herdmanii]|uniref:carbohydrate ABC transporter permease n=1 Tax=Geminocystis herdmanii TaxID=669359 RepID=UPI00034C6581|nr:sugar ABC transporter permease [Geminocystis herdmanii]